MDLNTGRHLLQSDKWAEFQIAQGKQIIQRSGKNWQYLAIIEKGDGKAGSFFRRLYVPYGPSYKDIPALESALNDLEAQAKKLGVDYIRVEPLAFNKTKSFKSLKGYLKAKRTFQPDQTLIIDLDRAFDDVYKDTTKTNRYLYKKASQNGIVFSESNRASSLKEFLEMMNATAKRTKAAFKPDSYYKKLLKVFGPSGEAGIAYAKVKDEILVGAIFVDDPQNKVRYYLYAGSFDKARKYSANSPLLMYLIEGASKKGFKYFDLFGVSPENDTTHRWAGLSKFKRSFGGQEVLFNGTYEKPINKFKYKTMTVARKLAK